MLYDQFVNWDHSDDNQKYACCPLHVEKTPSFTVNVDTQEWYCHGCGKGGSEKEFLMAYYDVDNKVAKSALTQWEKKGTMPFPKDDDINKWHNTLLNNPKELQVLLNFGFTIDVIKQLSIGLEDIRITFPIKSKTGHWVNVRKYLPPHRRVTGGNNQKCINIRNLGQRRYYPYIAFEDDSQPIVIVEGEKDMVAARSQGINAVTGTGGSAIPSEELRLFQDKDVALMLDTDSVGERVVRMYIVMLKPIAKSIQVIRLPDKDFVEYYENHHDANIWQYCTGMQQYEHEHENREAQDTSLVKSEFTENLNTWVKLNNMSVVGVEPRIYSIPRKLKVTCRNLKCNKPCPISISGDGTSNVVIDVDPRQTLQFIDSSDNAQDTYIRKLFGCKSAIAEGMDYLNVQKLIFQESASFIDGLEEASFENRYGIYMYTDYRLSATLKYNFEACRVTDPRSQQNYYVIRDAQKVDAAQQIMSEQDLQFFHDQAQDCITADQLISKHYNTWLPVLAIEGREDLFGALILTYCSVTEIPWQGGLIKGWLDTMVIGDTRTGKSQMAQRFVKQLGLGGYINGENARRTGVIGGVQKFGDSWVVTWGAIPMNDRGLLMIDEASGLEIEDVKDLSSTRSSGAVTLNKIVKGEARARTRLIWLSNPRSGKNLSDFYWKGFGAFQEFIPVMEDQARYDLVLTAAREDVEVLQGVETDSKPSFSLWRSLISQAWSVGADDIVLSKEISNGVREVSKKINDDLGGGSLVVGVAVHEKILRLTCAFAVLCGSFVNGRLIVTAKHLQFADQFLRQSLNKPSFGYGDFIREFKRAQLKRKENMDFVRALVATHPALKSLLTASSFKGFQFQEILGIDRTQSSAILSDLITRGLLRPGHGASYVPDKLLMEIAKQMEV